jgi:hypothetical protein
LEIKKSSLPEKELAVQHGCSLSLIYRIKRAYRRKRRKPTAHEIWQRIRTALATGKMDGSPVLELSVPGGVPTPVPEETVRCTPQPTPVAGQRRFHHQTAG